MGEEWCKALKDDGMHLAWCSAGSSRSPARSADADQGPGALGLTNVASSAYVAQAPAQHQTPQFDPLPPAPRLDSISRHNAAQATHSHSPDRPRHTVLGREIKVLERRAKHPARSVGPLCREDNTAYKAA